MKLESAESSSLEDRVKRNIHSIQRTPASLDNFMKRWKGICRFKTTRTSRPFSLFLIYWGRRTVSSHPLNGSQLCGLKIKRAVWLYVWNNASVVPFLNFTRHLYSDVAGSLLIIWFKLCTVYSFSFYCIRPSISRHFCGHLWIATGIKLFSSPLYFIRLPLLMFSFYCYHTISFKTSQNTNMNSSIPIISKIKEV